MRLEKHLIGISQAQEKKWMSIKLNLGSEFQPYIGNREAVEVKGKTVRECLGNLIKKYPEINKILFDENGTMLILIIHNQQLIRQDDIDMGVVDGDEFSLIKIASGG